MKELTDLAALLGAVWGGFACMVVVVHLFWHGRRGDE